MPKLTFPIVGGLFQVLIIVLFAILADYGDHAVPPHRRIGSSSNVNETKKLEVNNIGMYYPSKFVFNLVIVDLKRKLESIT